MKGQLVFPALVGIALMLSLSVIPAYAISYEKSIMIMFKDADDRHIANAECLVIANDFVYYTITNSYGFATIFLPGNTPNASVECSDGSSHESVCDVFLRHSTTKVLLKDDPYNLSESCN